MQIKISKKNILICLLLCSLLLTSYISVLNANGIIPVYVNIFERSSLSGGSEHSSMNDGANSGYVGYMAPTDNSIDLSVSSMKQSRWPVPKTGFNILTAIIVAQIICFIYSSRLSDSISTPFNSIRITFFLHKKDGTK